MTGAPGGDGWRPVAWLLFAVSFGTNIATPLLVVYRARLGLAPAQVTGVFAVYALGLMLALLLAGPGSDRVGRRPVVLPFAALSALTSLVFLPASRLELLLFVARFLQGFVSGAVFSVASAWMREVSVGAPVAVSARRASIAMNAGFSIGPLTAGLLAQYAPAPTVLPFLVHVALALSALVVARRVPETLRARTDGARPALRLPAASRREFRRRLIPTAVPIFAFPATAATVLPFLLPSDVPMVAVAGLVAGLVLGAAAVVAPAGRPLGAAAAPIGCGLGTAGLLLAVAATVTGSWPLLLPASVLLGTGSGLAMTAGLTLAEQLSTDDSRGAVYAAFYAVAYAGFGVPVVITLLFGERLAVPLTVLAVVMAAIGMYLLVLGRRQPTVLVQPP